MCFGEKNNLANCDDLLYILWCISSGDVFYLVKRFYDDGY